MHQTLRTVLTCFRTLSFAGHSAPGEEVKPKPGSIQLQNSSLTNKPWPQATSVVSLNHEIMNAVLPFRQLRSERSISVRLGLMAVLLVTLFLGGVQSVQAQYKENVGPATVITDKPDYAPRSNAVFTGAGFRPGETV